MKTRLFFTVILTALLTFNGFAQVAVNTNGDDADASAMLDIQSDSLGILIPRMTASQRNAISNPAPGLMVFVTDDSTFYFYKNSGWLQLSTGENNWLVSGNFIYTTGDSIGIGASYPYARLTVSGRISQIGLGESVFLGQGAGLNDDLSNNWNTFIGYYAGFNNTTGESNVVCGRYALYNNYIGDGNIAIGNASLYYNSRGNDNIALGSSAMFHLGHDNYSISQGNIAIGKAALSTERIGSNSVAIGTDAMADAVFSNELVAVGDSALFENNALGWAGDYNTAIGSRALRHNNAGSYNAANGYQTLYSNISGDNNTANGFQALYSNTGGDNNTANGYQALYFNTIGDNNTATGYQALYFNKTGHDNTAYGYHALYNDTAGYNNSACGNYALDGDTTGNNNTALGYNADVTMDGLSYATAIGSNAKVSQSNSLILGGTGAAYVNVGIGTTSPGVKLEVNGPTAGSAANIRSFGDIHLGYGSTSGGGLYFGTNSYSWNSGDYIRQASLGRIDITAAGTLGTRLITDNTFHGVKIINNGDAWLRIGADNDNSGGDDGTQNAYLQFTTDGGNDSYDGLIWLENLNNDTKLHFDVENQDVMVMHDGNVGIGTTSPTAPLEIKSDVSPSLIIGSSTNNYTERPGIQFKNNTSQFISGDDASNELFGFYSKWSNTRTYDAKLRVFGKATNSWGKYIEFTHDGTNATISTDAGNISLEPHGGEVQVTGKVTAPVSGNADMKAYIYGKVSGNNNAVVTSASSGGFYVTDGVDGYATVHFNENLGSGNYYIVIVTLNTLGRIWVTNKTSVSFEVRTKDNYDNFSDEDFEFVVYKK